MPHAQPPSPGRVWPQRLVALAMLAAGGAGAWIGAHRAARWIEADRTAAAQAALASVGAGWARVSADGLRLRLEGQAPDAAAQAGARAALSALAPGAQLIDATALAAAEAADAGLAAADGAGAENGQPTPGAVPAPPGTAAAAGPDPRIEILRTGPAIDLIGRAPGGTDHAALRAMLGRAVPGAQVTDLLQPGGRATPDLWDEALGFAVSAAAQIAGGRIVVTPAAVHVTAAAASAAERDALQRALRAGRPDDVALTLDIGAPAPVVSPYALEIERGPDGTRLVACAADSDAARQRLRAALQAAGVAPEAAADCPVALGAPSDRWAEAGEALAQALAALPEGRATIRDAKVTLSAPPAVAQGIFDAAAENLRAALPPGFSLATEHPLNAAPAAAAPAVPRLVAKRENGGVTLDGAAPDARLRDVVESYARARFGTVAGSLGIDPALPEGWSVRTIAALEALGHFGAGSVEIGPDLVAIEGTTGERDPAPAIARDLGRRLGGGVNYRVAARHDPRLDPAAGLPDGEACAARLNQAVDEHPFAFAAGEATLAGDASAPVAALRAAFDGCDDFRIAIEGHTDSDGPDDLNLALSAGRAEAALAALRAAGVPVANLTAEGRGEAEPVATNDTPEGRAANRRLAFRLLDPARVARAGVAATVVEGRTEAPPAEAPQDGGAAAPAPPRPAGPAPSAVPPPLPLGLPPTDPSLPGSGSVAGSVPASALPPEATAPLGTGGATGSTFVPAAGPLDARAEPPAAEPPRSPVPSEAGTPPATGAVAPDATTPAPAKGAP